MGTIMRRSKKRILRYYIDELEEEKQSFMHKIRHINTELHDLRKTLQFHEVRRSTK